MSAVTKPRPTEADWRREVARSAAVSAARRKAASSTRRPTMAELTLAVIAGSAFGGLVVMLVDRAL